MIQKQLANRNGITRGVLLLVKPVAHLIVDVGLRCGKALGYELSARSLSLG